MAGKRGHVVTLTLGSTPVFEVTPGGGRKTSALLPPPATPPHPAVCLSVAPCAAGLCCSGHSTRRAAGDKGRPDSTGRRCCCCCSAVLVLLLLSRRCASSCPRSALFRYLRNSGGAVGGRSQGGDRDGHGTLPLALDGAAAPQRSPAGPFPDSEKWNFQRRKKLYWP